MPNTKAAAIPESIQQQVNEIVQKFNRRIIKDPNRYYVPRFKGKYLHLDRVSIRRPERICRLKYNGQIDNWDFAIFKYSDMVYDPDEWAFPGSNFIDGTVEGAMKAGLEAYPD
jgi:hypothetical protein